MAEIPDTSFELLPLAAKRRIDAICTRFEQAWKQGRPRLENFFLDAPEEERAVLLAELLILDLEYRRKAGETPVVEDYLGRFPGLDRVVRLVVPAWVKCDTAANDPAQTVRVNPVRSQRPGEIPGYEVLEEVGRGGMGVVYKARHLALNRLVALKFILAGQQASSRHVERFRREAEVVARLRHPNIVQIYDIGEVDGQCFLALEYAEGGSLRERLAGSPMDPRAAAALLEPLARAVQHAHRQGIIHRDLKPGNILLAVGGDSIAHGNEALPEFRASAAELPRLSGSLPPLSACTPKLTDFGLARMLDADPSRSESGLTAGTPQYMAPEQALGLPDGGPMIDVWALGATLYEVLTGRPPFRAVSARETLRLVLEADPVAPSELQPSIPRDLETICLKCLEKEPSRRYAGARELAQDLRRFLDGEAIYAQRSSRVEKLVKWARRHPGYAAGFLFFLGGVVATSVLLLLSWFRAHHGWQLALESERAVLASLGLEREFTRQAHQARAEAEQKHRQALLEAARLLFQQAEGQFALGETDRGIHDLLTALRLSSDVDPALERLLRLNLAGWLPFVPAVEAMFSTREEVLALAVTPQGHLLTGGREGILRRLDREGQRVAKELNLGKPIRFLCLHPDGTQLLVGHDHQLSLWQLVGEQLLWKIETSAPITDALFASADQGVFTAAADGRVRLWTMTGKPIGESLVHPLPARKLALSPDGSTLAVALGRDEDQSSGAVWLWDWKASAPSPRVLSHARAVFAVAFHPSGQQLFSGGADGRVQLWDLKSGKKNEPPLEHPTWVLSLQPTAEGRTLLTTTREGITRLWDVSARQVVALFHGGLSASHLVDQDRQIALVSPGDIRLRSRPRPRSRPPLLLPTTSRLAASLTASVVFADTTQVAFSEHESGFVWVRDVRNPAVLRPPWRHGYPQVTHLVLDRRGKHAATICSDEKQSAVQVWDPGTGRLLAGPWKVPTLVTALSIHPEGSEVAVGDDKGILRRWETFTGKSKEDVSLPGAVSALAYAPDGRTLALGIHSKDGSAQARIWDVQQGRELSGPCPHPSRIRSLSYSPDGNYLLVISDTIRLWRLDSRTPRTPLVRHATFGRFSNRGDYVLIGTSEGQLWRYCVDREEAPVSVRHPAPILAADLSREGTRLLVAGEDGTARLWDISGSPQPLGPPTVCGAALREVHLIDQEKAWLSLTVQGDLRIWPIPETPKGSLEDLERRIFVHTGREVEPSGRLSLLSPTAWMLRRARLEPSSSLALSAVAWHEEQACEARLEGDLFAERWHLDRLLALQPNAELTRRDRVVLLVRMGKYVEALADLRQLAGDDKDRLRVELEYGLSRCLAHNDRSGATWFRQQLSR